jgi:hypothetical protein
MGNSDARVTLIYEKKPEVEHLICQAPYKFFAMFCQTAKSDLWLSLKFAQHHAWRKHRGRE